MFDVIFALVVNFPPIEENQINSQHVLFVHFDAYYKTKMFCFMVIPYTQADS